MKQRKGWRCLYAGLILAAFLLAVSIPTMAATPRTFRMRGKITAVDPADHTVVINVPIGKNKFFTVAGPLASDAVLKKGNRSHAMLKDFHTGETVIVQWQYTKEGHLIKALIGE